MNIVKVLQALDQIRELLKARRAALCCAAVELLLAALRCVLHCAALC